MTLTFIPDTTGLRHNLRRLSMRRGLPPSHSRYTHPPGSPGSPVIIGRGDGSHMAVG